MPITNRRIAAPEGSEFYPTPPVGTEIFLDLEEFFGDIWECACGDGAMSFVLEDFGYNVLSSDANDHGYGNRVDFLNSKFKVDNIVTNPPYLLAEEFIHHALKLAKRKVAMLLRLPFLEGSGRFERIYSKCPPSRVYVFSSRLTFFKKKSRSNKPLPTKGGTTAYAWYVWDKEYTGNSEIYWLPPIKMPRESKPKAVKPKVKPMPKAIIKRAA